MNNNELLIYLCNRNHLADNCVSQAIENIFADTILKSGPEVSIRTTENLHVQKMYVFM